MSECVYFVRAADGEGPIKIGYTSDFDTRAASLQAMSPVALVTLATIDGDRMLELALHRHFAEHRQHGEWFAPHSDILAYIEAPYTLIRTGERTFSDMIRSWGIGQFAADVGLKYFHAGVMVTRNSIPVDHWSRVIAASDLRGEPLTAADLLAMHDASRNMADTTSGAAA